MSHVVAELVQEALAEGSSLPHYSRALKAAFASAPPPYGERSFGDEFRCMARDPSWLAGLLVSNADLEGYSGRQLWLYANGVQDPDFASEMRQHARDEVSHSKLFARLLFELFPTLATDSRRRELAAMARPLREIPATPKAPWQLEELLNSVILINLHEVKALVLERLLEPVLLAYAGAASLSSCERMAERLLADEVEHIRYTARFVERAAEEGSEDYVLNAFRDFQGAINQVTRDEVEQARASFAAPREAAPCSE